MASTINATSSGSGGLITTGNSVNQLELQTGDTTRVVIDGSGNVTIQGQGDLRLADSDSSHYVALQAAGTIASNVTFTLPSADGTSGQVLQTNASGTLSFGNVGVANGGTGQTSLTANNVILGNGTSAVQFVAPGSSGNILTSNGTTWQSTAPAGGGSWVYLSSATASSSATVDLETTFDSTYATYAVVASNIMVGNDNASLGARLKVAGSYQTASYKWHSIGPTSNATTYVGYNSSSDGAMYMLNDLENNSGFVNEFVLYINEPTNSTNYKCIWGLGISWDQGNSQLQNQHFAGAYFGGTGAMTGIRFLCSAGNIASGTFRLYGIKNS